MNKKGFIAIPLLIAIIASVIAVSAVTTGAVLYKTGRLKLTASISEPIKEDTRVVEETEEGSQPEEIIQEEDSQQEPKPEVTGKIVYKDDPVLKATIQALEKQVQDLLNKDPEVKEVIKEVPVEKIVYREVDCPTCPTISFKSDITCFKKDLLNGYTLNCGQKEEDPEPNSFNRMYYVFRTTGEDFILRTMIVRLKSSPSTIFLYKVNEEDTQEISLRSYEGEGTVSVPLDGTKKDIIFPKDSEIIVGRGGYYNITGNPFEIIEMRFMGKDTGKIISLP